MRRGLVGSANAGANDNGSQFFITLGRADELNKKHTLFGKVCLNLPLPLLPFPFPSLPHSLLPLCLPFFPLPLPLSFPSPSPFSLLPSSPLYPSLLSTLVMYIYSMNFISRFHILVAHCCYLGNGRHPLQSGTVQ